MGKAPGSHHAQAQTTLAPHSGNPVMAQAQTTLVPHSRNPVIGQVQTAAQPFSGFEPPQTVCWNTKPGGGCTSNLKVYTPGDKCEDCQVSDFLVY